MPLLKRQAQIQPDKVAVRMVEGGQSLTFAALDRRADLVARWIVSLGLSQGDTLALLLENQLSTFELWWGARRAGVYYTPISTHLQMEELRYLLLDCGAKALVASTELALFVQQHGNELPALPVFTVGEDVDGLPSLENALTPFAQDHRPMPQRDIGREFFYSSGTTGRPKGIKRALQPFEKRYALVPLESQLRAIFRFDASTVYLSPSPLYHATARFIIRAIESGGTALVMEKFDAENSLAAIAKHRVTHSHWVPTMFVRMLALPDEVRARHDVSSMRCAIHAAAPCPPHVKDAMLGWWGDVIEEYYGGSENAGVTHIDSHHWRMHRGSVGQAIWGEIHILDEEGQELPVGQIGQIYFSGSGDFTYHNDPEKTATALNSRGWSSYGDMGHIDGEGYLYLSDRRADLILSGGVNVYPAEIENVLATHEAVDDVVVVGVPDAEFGELVKAVVHLKPGQVPSPELAQALVAHCRKHLSRFKAPKTIDFVLVVPRSENGKLLRRVAKAWYRPQPSGLF